MHRFLLFVLLAPTIAAAQPDADRGEEAAVLAAVNELWEGMRTGDSTRVRAVFHPDARGYSVGVRDGQVLLYQEETLDAFVTAVGTPHDEVWDERVSNVEVRVDGPFATYFADFEFWLGERRTHCGVNAFHLVKTDGAGWQIFVLSDTRHLCE
jgi:hypothetical protein